MERKALGLLCAVLLGLTASGARPATADETVAPEEALQGYGKLGVPRVELDASAVEELERRLAVRGFKAGSPVLIRIFKSEALLEVWIEVGGRFELFSTYPICNWSGSLGPKLAEGDKQSPEGLYSIGPRQLHYSARWKRALDIGFPNTFDRALKRTGSDLLVHGGCTSTGCYAITDTVMEEIFWLSEAALSHGQRRIQLHAFPFRMTKENLAAHADSEWSGFWANLKEAYDLFERTRRPPVVSICNTRYVVREVAKEDDGCTANISATEAWAPQRARTGARRVRARNAIRAYAAARSSRLAAKTKQRHAAQAADQRKLPR